ncbi:MAG: PKD domain-containing protein [Burkholderiaceae bacterium]|nr:PKD domain-containing protein [Burkholderiaceae bacterium]
MRNASGTVLAHSNPADLLSASINTSLASAGTYYLAVTGVGKGDPLATGYTKYGSVGQYALSGEVPAGSGQPPQVVLSAAPTQGQTPLTVDFSAAGSSDPDGSIAAYTWIFGDGSSGSGATANHTYTSPGSYTAQLRVTDNSGMTTTRSTTIVVDPVVATGALSVADIAMSLNRKKRNTRATATVAIRDGNGQAVANASVSGRWGGLVSSTATLITDAQGRATFTSPPTNKTSGTFTFTVSGSSLAGYTYEPTQNVETSDSISF